MAMVMAHDDRNDTFVQEYLPEIETRTLRHYNRLDREAREEALQEVRCLSWMMYRSAVAQGKAGSKEQCPGDNGRPDFTPCTLAWFANRHYDSGRRFAGSSTTDVLADGTRITGRVAITRIDDATFHEAFADRRAQNDPAWLAQTTIDWCDLGRSGLLNEKGQKTLKLLAHGYRNGELSRALGVCPARVSQIVHENVANAVVEFFGPSIVPAAGRIVEHGPQRKSHRRGREDRTRRKRSSRTKRRVRGAA